MFKKRKQPQEPIDPLYQKVRWLLDIGLSNQHRLIRVTYAVEEDIIIISARKASPANRNAYLTGLV